MNTNDVIHDLAQARGYLESAIEQVQGIGATYLRQALIAVNTAIAGLNGVPCRRCREHVQPDLITYSGDAALVYCAACDLHGVYWIDGRGYSISEVTR